MSDWGVKCKRADGEWVIVTVEAEHAEDALDQVAAHMRFFYGQGDAAGHWLAAKDPGMLVKADEARRLPWPPWEELPAQPAVLIPPGSHLRKTAHEHGA